MLHFGVLFLIVISGERIFLKKVLKNLNAFKNSGNIPDGQIFKKVRKKRERFRDFWQYTRCEQIFLKQVRQNLNAFQNFGNIPGGQLFLEKFEKSENGFNFFGNIPRVNENFSEKAVHIFGFLAIYPKKARTFSTFSVCTEHRNPKKGAEWILTTRGASVPRVKLFNEITMGETIIINKGKKWNEKI